MFCKRNLHFFLLWMIIAVCQYRNVLLKYQRYAENVYCVVI